MQQPAESLQSRTFVGLLVAQFLAAFNDQAIHASAMFFAIHKNSLSEATAISLMPILFYAPWALFCTLAGYFADRFSKRQSLVCWKVVEIGITLVALLGFWLGSGPMQSPAGPFVVLATVFLMGTHSAFFVPAKYGAMPEILPPQLLSKGNGLLESLSFLAVILGTVTGGILSSEYLFKGREYFIGVVLAALAVVGAIASLLIRKMPAANPQRPFPRNLFKPLVENLGVLMRSKPLALAVLGIAFFTFVVAFMRASVYMLGESHIPRWSEFKTSVIVGMSALGIGLGSPLAGYLSGGKVELGLVPLGAVGMIVAAFAGALLLNWLPALVICIILIGFCTGFFIVPLFTLLQHRAPKASKGESIATSNFINVVGAIAASVLFFALVFLAQRTGVVASVPQTDKYTGILLDLKLNRHGRPAYFRIDLPEGPDVEVGERMQLAETPEDDDEAEVSQRIEVEEDLINVLERIAPGAPVKVSTYTLPPTRHRPKPLTYYRIRAIDQPMRPAYDNEGLPRYLFAASGLMTLGILILLCRQLPDFFVRSLLWLRAHGRHRIKVVGLHNLPSDGPVLLASNCDRFDECMQVIAATDRYTRFVLLDSDTDPPPRPLLRYLARRTGLIALHPGRSSMVEWDKAIAKAARTLKDGHIVGVTADGDAPEGAIEKLLDGVRAAVKTVQLLPVYCERGTGRTRVVFGAVTATCLTPQDYRAAIEKLKGSPDSAHDMTTPPHAAG